ncbi:MAG: YfhO family protein [Chloroflexi bacterium]|nr:YfhO family protein [Chloroflexota bacterium]MCI0574664.1 YfhO family protein [Chloroflexota bacterium]MCI0649054.1 YfhO family protein [Chloroflexota bacterium]MCI0725153.1 YfhO family protein [Chloroflexota bacterium]
MKRLKSLRRTPLAYSLLVALLGLPLVTPLLRWTDSLCTHDGHLHYHRVAALRYAWESGLPFSRWLPDLAFGYGYPFLLYREAAPLYLSLLPHLLGLPLPAAINLFYTLCLLAAGWFTFLWVRDVLGPAAGLVAAVAYMAAPYQLVDALVRGNQPESLALPLLPVLLWAGRRFILQGTAWPFVLSTLGLALLALSHNISLLLFTPLFLVYLLAVGWLRQLTWRTALARLALLVSLGLGLSSFYLGPALAELDEITISQSVTARNNDYRFNFTSLAEILAPAVPEDPTLLNPPLPIRLGWAPAGLALLGVLSLLRAMRFEQRGHGLMMALAAVGLLLMALPLSRPLWDHLPLIEFVQFPWRFIGRAALPVAFLAGLPFAAPLVDQTPQVSKGTFRAPTCGVFPGRRLPHLAALAVALLLLEALPGLYPFYCQDEPYPTINTVHAYERRTGLVGVDPAGSYFPKTVQLRPDGSPLEADYQAGRPPQRFDLAALPAGATADILATWPIGVQVAVDSPATFQARYLSFAFPGWQATVDGRPVPITPTVPEGLLTFPVPAGRHTVEVRWELTPLRATFLFVTIVSLAGFAVTVVALAGQRPGRRPAVLVGRRQAGAALLPFLGVALAMLALKLFVVDRVDTPLRQPAPPPVSYPAELQAAGLRLAGYNLDRERVAAGDAFTIDLAWQVDSRPAGRYQSNVWLVGPEGLAWSDKETFRPRLYEDTAVTNLWLAGQWAWDSWEVTVFPGTPPGRYDVVLTLFDLANLQPLTLRRPDGTAAGPTAVIGQITVSRPETPPQFQPQYPQQEAVAGLLLLGYNQDRQEALPGEHLLLTFFWEKLAGAQETPATLELQLLDAAGRAAQSWLLPPARADYPPAGWPAGERVRGQHLLRLAAGLAGGQYQLALEGVALGTLAIHAPDRVFDEPAYTTAVDAVFEAQARLAGVTLEPAGPAPDSPLTVTLVWQGLAEMAVSYRVFVHLVDETGQIVAQSDAEPAAWSRPTTGWAPREYIVDTHNLALPAELPAGGLSLRVGLYDVDSGDRLRTGAAEFVVLPLVTK